MEGGGDRTPVTNVVPELDDKTSGSKGGVDKEGPIPFLRYVSISDV